MPATVTSLDRAIAREERFVGLPTDEPLTDAAIAHRNLQISGLLAACGCVALAAVMTANEITSVCAFVLAGAFGIYAIRQDMHLRRLATLRGDSRRITLVVASELMHTGALAPDRELLDMRDALGRAAGAIANALASVVPCDCTRVRLVGPSAEVPIAAERELAPRRPVVDDPKPALQALHECAPVRRQVDEHSVIVAPLWRGDDMIGLLEVVSPKNKHYQLRDAAQVDAFGRGAVAALLTPSRR